MRRVVAVNAAALWVLLITSAGAQAQKASGRQSIDIVVTRYVVDAAGERIGMPAQTVRYQLLRVKTDAGWKTTMTLGAPDGASPEEVARNPFFGGRVEFDATGAFAMFDRSGSHVPTPQGMRVPPLNLLTAEWSPSLDGISTAAQSRDARVREVEAKYGKPVGTVRGLSQYVRREGEVIEEVLFDRELGVPVELNVMEGERLTGHLGFAYVEQPGGGMVRRAMRSEAVLNDKGHRAITATEFSKIVSEQVQEQEK